MPNTNGGHLLRMKDDRYTAVVGTKGYRWKESEIVKNLGQEDQIDLLYFNTLMDKAIKTIEKFGQVDDFIDYDLNRSSSQEDLIGFDDRPPIKPIASAIFVKGE